MHCSVCHATDARSCGRCTPCLKIAVRGKVVTKFVPKHLADFLEIAAPFRLYRLHHVMPATDAVGAYLRTLAREQDSQVIVNVNHETQTMELSR